MVNNCPCCNRLPRQEGLISCQNVKCLEFGEKYFVWEWQNRKKETIDNVNIGNAIHV